MEWILAGIWSFVVFYCLWQWRSSRMNVIYPRTVYMRSSLNQALVAKCPSLTNRKPAERISLVTLFMHSIRIIPSITYTENFVKLKDNRVLVVLQAGANKQDKQPALLLIHGLLVAEQEVFITTLTKYMLKEGWKVFRMLLSQKKHDEQSSVAIEMKEKHIQQVIKQLRKESLREQEVLIALGFGRETKSLIQYLGQSTVEQVKAAIAVCSPSELMKNFYPLRKSMFCKQAGYEISNFSSCATSKELALEKITIPLLCVLILPDPNNLPCTSPFKEILNNPHTITCPISGAVFSPQWTSTVVKEFCCAVEKVDPKILDDDIPAMAADITSNFKTSFVNDFSFPAENITVWLRPKASKQGKVSPLEAPTPDDPQVPGTDINSPSSPKMNLHMPPLMLPAPTIPLNEMSPVKSIPQANTDEAILSDEKKEKPQYGALGLNTQVLSPANCPRSPVMLAAAVEDGHDVPEDAMVVVEQEESIWAEPSTYVAIASVVAAGVSYVRGQGLKRHKWF